ncbi:uncharacterized protein LOC135466047 [Liolophura sinensis]|uniref:uncharacterized protein LOC135466047 n=1 Tax=Liolophura sinensis TaxID=3198878 RepID=UPI003158A3E8
MGSPHHPDTPVRSYMDDPNIQWKTGKPDYSAVNEKYLKERTKHHKLDSMEKFVENLVKSWEMESTHKINPKDWQTVDRENFTVRANGGYVGSLQDNIDIGNYNIMLMQSPLFDGTIPRQKSVDLFFNAFPGGFAWELLELFSGPPVVTFTWRHWARWEGEFMGNEPTGEEIEMFGSTVARTNEDGKIRSVEVFFDPNVMLGKLMKFDITKVEGCPFSTKM